jgi:hypothetical protein
MSGHPTKCRKCRGAGYKPGPPITETNNGAPHRYSTVAECDHDWWNDEDGYDPYTDELLARDHPRAAAAYTEGLAQGRRDLWELSNGKQGAP